MNVTLIYMRLYRPYHSVCSGFNPGAYTHLDVYKRQASDGSLVKYQMADEIGNLRYVTDLDGNLLKDEAGNLIPAMAYDENYLCLLYTSRCV